MPLWNFSPALFLFCLSLSFSVGLPLPLSFGILFISLLTHTHTYSHTHNSLDTCIFDSCLRIINNFVFIYLFVCIWGWQKWGVCVCAHVLCAGVREGMEKYHFIIQSSTLKIYFIILAGYTSVWMELCLWSMLCTFVWATITPIVVDDWNTSEENKSKLQQVKFYKHLFTCFREWMSLWKIKFKM